MKNIDAALREAVANGVTQVQELYKAAIKYITDKWTGVFGDKQISKRSITDGKTFFLYTFSKDDDRLFFDQKNSQCYVDLFFISYN